MVVTLHRENVHFSMSYATANIYLTLPVETLADQMLSNFSHVHRFLFMKVRLILLSVT